MGRSNNNLSDGNNSRKHPPKLFLSLSSYNRFLRRSRRRSDSSLSLDSNSSSTGATSPSSSPQRSPDPVLYPLHEIISAVNNSLSDPLLSGTWATSPSSSPQRSPDPVLYPLHEIISAVNNSLSDPLLSGSYWHLGCNEKTTIPCSWFQHCTLRNEEVIIFCCHKSEMFPSHLSTLSTRSHHPNLTKIVGVSQSEDRGHIYLVYEDIVPGLTLRKCLQSDPVRTPLSNWIWRMQVALDLAQGLEYIHRDRNMVHHMLTSSTVIVTEPNSNAKICLFGAGLTQFGMSGYVAPETVMQGGSTTQKSDVFAFGVVILELISGKRPWGWEEVGETGGGTEIRWVDQRLNNVFPVNLAESLIRLARRCVECEPSLRPEMTSVVGDIQQLFFHSKAWHEQRLKSPMTAFSLSFLDEEEKSLVIKMYPLRKLLL